MVAAAVDEAEHQPMYLRCCAVPSALSEPHGHLKPVYLGPQPCQQASGCRKARRIPARDTRALLAQSAARAEKGTSSGPMSSHAEPACGAGFISEGPGTEERIRGLYNSLIGRPKNSFLGLLSHFCCKSNATLSPFARMCALPRGQLRQPSMRQRLCEIPRRLLQ
jgi:hypothetical protein